MRAKKILVKKYMVPGTTNMIISVTYDCERQQGRSFLRFMEYYESPEFKGKIFTFEDYKHYYRMKHGEFSYYEDWSGFNLKNEVIEPFQAGLFDPLSKEEKFILSVAPDSPKFTIIGVSQEFKSDETHELAHSLYYLYPEYRAEITKLITQEMIDELNPVILDGEYVEDNLLDEIQAYMVDSVEDLFEDTEYEYLIEKYKPIAEPFKDVFNRYYFKLPDFSLNFIHYTLTRAEG